MLPATENPFIVQETKKQRIVRYMLCTLLLIIAPPLILLRLCIFVGIMFLQMVVFNIIDFGSGYPAPLGKIRFFLYQKFSSFIGFLFLINMGFIPIVTRQGIRKQHKDARGIVMNHSGLLDIPVSQYAITACPVAKQSLYNNMFLRGLIRASRCVLIKRESEQLKGKLESKVSVPLTSVQLMQQRAKQSPVAIMPEGTIPAPNYILKFRTGIFRLGVPIQPVSYQFCSPIKLTWATHSLLYSTFMMLINPFGIVFITYHDVIYPNDGQTPEELAEIARNAMVAQLKAKKVDYQNNDFIYFKSGKGVPTKEWIRDFGWMGTCQEFSKKYNINYKLGIYTWEVAHIKPKEEYYHSEEYKKLYNRAQKQESIKTVPNTQEILNIKEANMNLNEADINNTMN